MVFGMLSVGIILGALVVLAAGFSKILPKQFAGALGFGALVIVFLAVVGFLGGSIGYDVQGFINGIPIVGPLLLGLMFGIAGASIAVAALN